jgi:hypothetical protein
VKKRPTGADNFLKLRRSIDEHLELGRITWGEFGMFVWLCVKASPRTGILRTGWPTLALQTGLSADRVEQLCRALRRKRYVWYPSHRGSRGRLIELAIDKFPTVDGGYTDLTARFTGAAPASRTAAQPSDLRTDVATGSRALPHRTPEWPTELGPRPAARAPMATELDDQSLEESRGSPPGRLRRDREREQDRDGDARVLRARRAHDAHAGQRPPCGEETATPVAIRDLLATQPWWRPSADGRPSLTTAEAGETTDGDPRPTAPSAGPGGATR